MEVYAQPVDYWKNYYNMFDFAILVVSFIHEILLGVELGGTGVTFLRMAAGQSHTYCTMKLESLERGRAFLLRLFF